MFIFIIFSTKNREIYHKCQHDQPLDVEKMEEDLADLSPVREWSLKFEN